MAHTDHKQGKLQVPVSNPSNEMEYVDVAELARALAPAMAKELGLALPKRETARMEKPAKDRMARGDEEKNR